MVSTTAWDRERLKRDRVGNLQKEMTRRGIGGALLSAGLNVNCVLEVCQYSSAPG